MSEWYPRKHKHKTDGNNEANIGLENRVQNRE